MIRFFPSLKAGQKAPDFSRPDGKGKLWQLSDFEGKWLVLFFYPADFTSGCSAESCSFRDRYQDFEDAGAEVVGISGDSQASHQAFAAEHRLPYLLLSDEDASMRRAYTVPHIFGRLSGRTTFVIGPDGLIRDVFNGREDALAHVTRSLEFIRHGN